MSEKRVLVVDDARTIRFAIRDFLEGAGFRVSEAEDCNSARSAMRRDLPHVVVLDHQLPDGNALELLPDLLSNNEHVVVIVLTAHGSEELAEAIMRAGAKRLFRKPLPLPALSRTIDELLAAV
jgi:DNA-binding NtrC family response regulator